MEVTELVQYNLQIRVQTGRGAKGCQAAVILMAFGNSDMTAGSKADLFLLGKELCFGISPTTALHQPAGVRQERDGVTSTGLSLPPPSHGGRAGIEEELESLRFWETRIPFQKATPATLQGTAPRALWLKPVGFSEGATADCSGLVMSNVLMRRHDEQLTNQTPMKL